MKRLLSTTLLWFYPLIASICSAAPPAITLAERYEGNIDLNDYFVSEKLDGVRAYWNGRALISRQGNAFAAPDWFIAALPPIPLDGELWAGRGQFEFTVSAVKKYQPVDHEWRRIQYQVFDLPGNPAPFNDRLKTLKRLLSNMPGNIQLVAQTTVASEIELQQMLDQVTAKGGEGLMLRCKDSLYIAGRSDDLLKLKPRYDSDAEVIAHIEGKGQFQGMLGSIEVKTTEGTRFRIGSGFTHQQRRDPPPIGSIISYYYSGLTRNGLPRHPVFFRQRPDKPPSE